MTGRPVRLVVAGMATLVLLLSACGGDDDAGSGGGGGGGDRSEQGGGDAPDLRDPCELVSMDDVSELLGGEAAEPEATSSDIAAVARNCTWETQANKDNPTMDTVAHFLTLSTLGPPPSMDSAEELFEASKELKTDDADLCDESFWAGGELHAMQGGVYLTASAGLNDDSDDAKEAVTGLMEAACASV